MPQPPPSRRSRLADGREILYFDDDGSSRPPPLPDGRRLDQREPPAELRHDALTDEWVVVAGHRQDRTHLPPAGECPLCPTRDTDRTEIPDSDYDVVVFENRFPSLPAAPADGPGAGRCEVVAYTSDHSAAFGSLPDERLRTLGRALAQRTEALGAVPQVANVFCFENRGEEIGVTLHHPHGQIYAYPFLPGRVQRMAAVAARAGACVGCARLAAELASGERIVLADAHGVAYVPVAARWPFEVHLVPRRHLPDLAAAADDERDALLRLQAEVLARLGRLFERPPPYMAGWLQAPIGAGRDLGHLRLEVASPRRAVDRLKYLAGSESLAGAWVNDIRPEEAARRLRAAPGR